MGGQIDEQLLLSLRRMRAQGVTAVSVVDAGMTTFEARVHRIAGAYGFHGSALADDPVVALNLAFQKCLADKPMKAAAPKKSRPAWEDLF